MSDRAEPRDLIPLPEPLPGLARLRRRLADRGALRDDLLARLAEMPTPAGLLGDRLDVAGDPTVVQLAELWARVADGVSAYTELTAGETYLGTAQDWTDVRRVAALTGHRPSQRTAARGWIRLETAAGAEPMVPAGTRVQAPSAGGSPSQTYEVTSDTQVHADWAGLTVTAVPVPAAPTGNQLRFLSDPGFTPADRIVLVQEGGLTPPPILWWRYLGWLRQTIGPVPQAGASMHIRGVVKVTQRSDDLGATLLEFDRDLRRLLPEKPGITYAAYRIRAELRVASRFEGLTYVMKDSAITLGPASYGVDQVPISAASWYVLVEDASAVSREQYVLLHQGDACLVTTVESVTPLDWRVAPGMTRRVAQLKLRALVSDPAGILAPGVAVLLVDERKVAQHYDLNDLPGDVAAARVHPRPAVLPDQLAVQTIAPDGRTGWELTRCTANALDTTDDTGGLQVTLADPRAGRISRGAATGNLAPIRHGTTGSGPLTINDGVTVIAGPVTADAAADGTVTDSMVVVVDGVRWDEVPSLYGRGPSELVYSTRLAADGQLVLQFGDGITGALPRGAVTATWRTGGGLAGEVDGAQITVLSGSITGVRAIQGVGPMSGAADQDDEAQLKRAAPARIRALDRAVALGDLADLALTVPGTSHSVSWRGFGPPGCSCGRSGLHVAVLRLAAGGVRTANPSELLALSRYLDDRRDTTIPLCVAAAVSIPITIGAQLAIDPRRTPAAVLAAATGAVLDPGGPLAPAPRGLGLPLDGSDVIEVVQPVPGVLGITDLTLTGGTPVGAIVSPEDLLLGRRAAARYELLWVTAAQLGVRSNG
ncbi:hypothetical protein ACPPVO_36400 [Dactylosporangium sp. McL0621]|uniref:hypothetical protein n=1 Tax=Dactylosporangium sp. McL0621 TaxID=3415678 RepID=UPI003CF70151